MRFRVLRGEMDLDLMGVKEMGFLRADEVVDLVIPMAAVAAAVG